MRVHMSVCVCTSVCVRACAHVCVCVCECARARAFHVAGYVNFALIVILTLSLSKILYCCNSSLSVMVSAKGLAA